MATWDDVRRAVADLPEVDENVGDTAGWRVADKTFAWERPLRKGDVAVLGDAVRDSPVLAVRVADEGVKQALVADDPEVFFTTPHFDGYPAVLVWLDRIEPEALAELIVEGWLARAPRRTARAYLDR
ncbi:MAG: hypothetical protein QOJ11_1195 [Frankiales bacterium]|nr:hypothetical protein [Frankiales bacterium]